MKIHFCLSLLALTFVVAATAIPATAMTTVTVMGQDQQARQGYTHSLDILGPVKSQDTIDYDDGLDT